MKKQTYINRYNDEYVFTLQEDGNILWEGPFKYCRYGWPNDYSEAWKKFQEDYGGLSFEDFKTNVHAYDDEKREYVFPELVKLVKSDNSRINMVDPSGGPYLHEGMEFMGKEISSFEFIEEGEGLKDNTVLIKTKQNG